MNDVWDKWDLVEQDCREALVKLTGLIKNEDVAGVVFAAGLIVLERTLFVLRELYG